MISTAISTASSIMATAGGVEKKKTRKQAKQIESQLDAEEVVAIDSDVESNWALIIDEPAEEASTERNGTTNAVSKREYRCSIVGDGC